MYLLLPILILAMAWRYFVRYWLGICFFLVVLTALAMRLWELDFRAMHYDEAIHVHFAWKLASGKEFIHSPWMHGPFQVELTALIFRLFGDTDFTARVGYVAFGTGLVALPYFLRDHIGKAGALFAAIMLTLSPSLLYFSRFGRNDIIMAFWATALLIVMWRYVHEGRNRYLYIASALLAFLFATKETAYIIVLIFGAIMFLLAIPDLIPWALGRVRFSQLAGPAGFLVLLVTLTLPHWAAFSGLAQDALGLALVNREGVDGGIVGAPDWASPFVALPVYQAPWWLHLLASGLMLGALLWLNRRTRRLLMIGTAVSLAAAGATAIVLLRPFEGAFSSIGSSAVDLAVTGVLVLGLIASLVILRQPGKRGTSLAFLPALAVFAYLVLFTSMVDVDSVVHNILPTGVSVDASANAIPVNYLVAGGLLFGALALSVFWGVLWMDWRWLVCAAIFYVIWVALYTTGFENFAGVFSGVWQGAGYWIAQQDVGRGNQPWYYYFVGLSVYELLPVIFGLAGAVYFLRRTDLFGLALAFWTGLNFLAYTLASEKMPWLLVNVTLPFVLLSGKYLGELAENVRWRDVFRRGQVVLLALPPLVAVGVVYFIYRYVNLEGSLTAGLWGIIPATLLLTLASAVLIRLAKPPSGMALTGLGLAGLLLAFGITSALRAAYTYDDSNKEILVYAQGSADLPATFRALEGQVFSNSTEDNSVMVDYDMWYPFQWYARHHQDEGTLQFSCFKADGEDGWNDSCKPVPEDSETRAYLLTVGHGGNNAKTLSRYQRTGPFQDLLWFPESYRRPHENRQDEGFQGLRGVPSLEQLRKDFGYFKEVATSRRSWSVVLSYLVFRDLDDEWFDSEYYSYLP